MNIRNPAFALVCALLAACASAGNEKVRTETMASVGAKVTKGVTTKDQVKALYGEPMSVSLTDAGGEVWHYAYAHATATAVSFVPIVGLFAGGADVNKNEVVFIFDKNNVVQNYTVHASQSEVRRGGGDVNTQ
ncbi:MAG TPA: outer membrane protein assembly factor BamE [Candidatus Sulfotelmatobacter sp.]|nr:outer membrane protein assembly factor BamE [Candidatus Sulfotelmatobacter sp.]